MPIFFFFCSAALKSNDGSWQATSSTHLAGFPPEQAIDNARSPTSWDNGFGTVEPTEQWIRVRKYEGTEVTNYLHDPLASIRNNLRSVRASVLTSQLGKH